MTRKTFRTGCANHFCDIVVKTTEVLIQHIVFMFIFMLTLAYYCDEKAPMLTKIFPYNSNNLQPVKQIPKIFQVVQKLSRYFHTDQKIQTVRRLSKLSGHSLDISVEFQRPNFPDLQNFLFPRSIANSPTSV